ncbi:GNAT family N-acetyltransferase [Ferrimonas gelatinilytica]|uniref:N-acetyltransferase domain-containing protein n=1 Tax=Ferrimonas gelatinilytica TaxID=1255257 RepID=A0ABP9RW47_9GAMM
MQLRQATMRDLPAILALWPQQGVCGQEPLHPYIASRGRTYVIVNGRNLIGFVCISRVDARIVALCVALPYRRCGLGRALLMRAQHYLHWLGARTVRLSPAPDSQAFYRALGWQPMSHCTHQWCRRLK